MTQTVYLSLGSNLGDRPGNLQAAIAALTEQLDVVATSSLYETEPWGVSDQPFYLNIVVGAWTHLAPRDLLRFVKGIERRLGRQPPFRWGPRTIDIDILLYGDQVLDEPDLRIPHQDMPNRAFVLVPLAEIAPQAVHPISGETVRHMADLVPGQEGVQLYQSPNLSSPQGSPSM